MKEYRYLTQPSHIKKGKPNMVAALLGAKFDVAKISNLTSCPTKTVESYMKIYEQAKLNKNPEKFKGLKIEGDDVVELYAMCA